MNLKLVTWEGDLTQFLVDAETNEDAVEQAIEANKEYDSIFSYYPETDEEDKLHLEAVNDVTCYTVEDVDFCLLREIFQRDDRIGIYGSAIMFND